ncbi:MAG: PilN domain-containing protein [Deltaproteobacteria bacterium]|nr:PilN domain-containing protein [Deltaproteobacteria bacterium]
MDAHAHVFLERPEDLEKGLASCIETVSGQANIANAVCVVALPSDQFFYRNIASPFTDPRKIDQMLPYELEQSLPVPADDLIIDFIPVSRAIPEKEIIPRLGKLFRFAFRAASARILTAAIEKTRLSAYLTCLKQFGFEPERIAPGGYALSLCLMHATDSPPNWLLVDADKAHTALFLVLSRTLTVIRAFPSAGLSPSVDFLLPLIQQTLLASGEETRIDRIFLTGGSNASAVVSELSEKCGLPVHLVNLVADADIRLKSALPSGWRPETGDPALGAALARMNGFSGLNLRKGAFSLRAFWGACRSGLLTTGIMAGLAILAAFAYVRVDTQILEKQLDVLNRRIDQVLTGTFPEITTIVEPLHQMRTHVQNAQNQIPGSDKKGQERLVDLLGRISSRIPEDVPVELARLVYEDGTLQLTGHTDSFNSVEEIKRRLEGPNSGFSLVTIVSANLESTGSRIQFHLNITL